MQCIRNVPKGVSYLTFMLRNFNIRNSYRTPQLYTILHGMKSPEPHTEMSPLGLYRENQCLDGTILNLMAIRALVLNDS